MIVITGANGKLGRLIVNSLLKKIPAEQIGVSVQDISKAEDLRAQGVRVRQGDFRDAASLLQAFEGASQVLIVSASTTGGDALLMHRTAIETAKLAGATRILYTSHMGANPNSAFAPMPDNAATEAILKESGVAFTSLRNGFYASTIMMLLEQAMKSGELIAPEDGPVSWTNHSDLAEAAGIALTKDGSLNGITPPLTASEALNYKDIAAIASELTGRSIKRITLSDQDFKKQMVANGTPEKYVDMFLGNFLASRNREFSAVDPTLERLIGHAPISLRDLMLNEISKSKK